MTSPHKLLVVSVDAMHVDDIPFARTLPAFAQILERAVAEIEGIYPSVTYPNNTAQTTGLPAGSERHRQQPPVPARERGQVRVVLGRQGDQGPDPLRGGQGRRAQRGTPSSSPTST